MNAPRFIKVNGKLQREIDAPKMDPRPGARGPFIDTETDQRCTDIRACLKAWGFSAGYAQIAAVLSVERCEPVTADAVRARFRRMER